MKPHEERVVVEKRELDDKLGKLNAFIVVGDGGAFASLASEDQLLLREQYASMAQYSDILRRRIERFGA